MDEDFLSKRHKIMHRDNPSTCYPYLNLPFMVGRWDLKLLARNFAACRLAYFRSLLWKVMMSKA